MKKLRRILFVLIFSLSLTLISSCSLFTSNQGNSQNNADGNTTNNTTDDKNPSQDNNSENVPDDSVEDDKNPVDTTLFLPITEDGLAKVRLVCAYSKDKELFDAINSFKSNFADVTFEEVYATTNIASEREILIGDSIGAQGNFYIDPHSLGDEGYAIRVVANKIIVAGGNTESLVKALEILSEDILKLASDDTDTNNLYISRDVDVFERQYYPITAITVNGNDLAGYDIVCDTKNDSIMKCADSLHNSLYSKAGYWTSIRSSSKNPSIRILLSDYAGNDGFMVYTDGEDLVVECAYPVLLEETFEEFLDTYFASDDERTISFTEGSTYSIHIRTITYCTYGGAVGDGIADDFEAIKSTHNRANITGQTVVADVGKIFNLGQHTTSITIRTDTDWTGATFIIDDSEISPDSPVRNKNVFTIASDTIEKTISGITSLSKGQENIGVKLGFNALLYIVDNTRNQYIRYGANADNGAYQQEVILVDKDGNVDPSTPILWDYETVYMAVAYSVENKPITITGGHFITIANNAPREYTYYARGIAVMRSNVTMRGQLHTIEGEGESGAPYNGFVSISYAHNVLFDSITFTGHKIYKLSSNASNSMGTYDISVHASNNITWRNCTQTNSITDTAYWGVMGSNYCKNLTYDSCVLSRFDAHKGTHNATIINSEIGHQRINAIGSGVLLIENTKVYGNNIVNLRNDYGSTWQGDIILRNITLVNTSTPTLINAVWTNHYFGYTCYMPENITIDGITLAKGTSFRILPSLSTGIDQPTYNGAENCNPYVLTKRIIIESNPNGYSYTISNNMTLFANVALEDKTK